MESKENRLQLGRYIVGNYYIKKEDVELTDSLLDGIADSGVAGMVKYAYGDKGTVPYITIGDLSGLVRIRYLPGTEVYNAIDTLESEDGSITGKDYVAAENFISVLMSNINIVGDKEYIEKNIENISSYIERLGIQNMEN